MTNDEITLIEARKRAGLTTAGSLHRAAQTGRLTTVTMAAGPHARHLTTRAWLHASLDRQRHTTEVA